MVVSCVARSYAEVQRIRRALVAVTGALPASVFDEKIAEDAFVVSVRIENDTEIQKARQSLSKMGIQEISEFMEAA